jgi:uncharacterized protein (DUF1800 family)
MSSSLASAEALVAHVLRRCAIAPDQGRVARFVQGVSDPKAAATAALDWALSVAPRPILPAQQSRDGWEDSLNGWTDNLRSSDAGLHERMTWFWHGYFATGSDKIGNLNMLHTQQQLLRTHALGNFGSLLRQMVTDPAMMFYLDLPGSSVEAPNENFARELMELFTIGPGVYTEDDVKAGALALAGYDVDYETAKVSKKAERSLGGEVVFLGQRGRFGVDEIVQILLAHEACAPSVAAKVYHHLVGVLPTAERRAQLGTVLRGANYEIRPLVENILRADDFLLARLTRPKFPIEWWVGALHALTPFRASEDQRVNPWVLSSLNQMPHRPPNVAGWPISTRWMSSDQQITRASYVRSVSWRMQPIVASPGSDLVTATLARCSLYEVSTRTRNVLNQAALATAGNADELTISRRLIAAALLSPEFALA